MFRVTFMCDDNKLGRAMQALAGIAAHMEVPQPVANAIVTKGKVRVHMEGTTLIEQLKNTLAGNQSKQVTVPEIKMIVTQLGYKPTSYAGAVWQLHKSKFLKRLEKGIYQVNH